MWYNRIVKTFCKGGFLMRKTQMSIVVNSENPSFSQKVLDILDHFEAVTAVAEEFSRSRVSQIHHNNKSAAFFTPFQIAENLHSRTIIINVFQDDTYNVLDHFENVVILKDGLDSIIQQLQSIADKYQIDLGDYIPDTTDIPQPSKDDCLLCRIYRDGTKYRNFLGPVPSDQSTRYPIMNTILYESKNFYLVPAKGALLEGYTMLVPKDHVWSFAALPHDILDEALEVLEHVKSLFAPIYGNDFVIFEHGSGMEGKCKHEKAIVHAHLHIVPSSLKMTPETVRNFHLAPLHEIHELHEYATDPYLLYMDSSMDWHISCDPDVYIPRQCVRQLLADELGLDGHLWNWRKHSFMDKIENTVMKYYKYLQSSFLSLDPDDAAATDGFLKEMELRRKF